MHLGHLEIKGKELALKGHFNVNQTKKILFVGSFKTTSKDGSVGGQMFASKSLINSSISEEVEWTLIDTTSNANILSSGLVRLRKAVLRLVKFVYHILFSKFDVILIFAGDGWSFWEKGLMAITGKYFTRAKVIIAPRSGYIINDINHNATLKKFITYTFEKVDVVICQSNRWKELFKCLVIKDTKTNFFVIENLLDFNKYCHLPIGVNRSDKPCTILFMAWVTKSKGIWELIEAVALLKKDNIPFKLIVAGKGTDSELVESKIRELQLADCIELKGWVLGDQKLSLLSETDIFVLPTHFDGYPNSLLEAMASAKACIATKVGSIPDMIDHDINGLLIDSHNAIQLYKSLKRLIENPDLRYNFSLKARETIKNRNSENVIIEKYRLLFTN